MRAIWIDSGTLPAGRRDASSPFGAWQRRHSATARRCPPWSGSQSWHFEALRLVDDRPAGDDGTRGGGVVDRVEGALVERDAVDRDGPADVHGERERPLEGRRDGPGHRVGGRRAVEGRAGGVLTGVRPRGVVGRRAGDEDVDVRAEGLRVEDLAVVLGQLEGDDGLLAGGRVRDGEDLGLQALELLGLERERVGALDRGVELLAAVGDVALGALRVVGLGRVARAGGEVDVGVAAAARPGDRASSGRRCPAAASGRGRPRSCCR